MRVVGPQVWSPKSHPGSSQKVTYKVSHNGRCHHAGSTDLIPEAGLPQRFLLLSLDHSTLVGF